MLWTDQIDQIAHATTVVTICRIAHVIHYICLFITVVIGGNDSEMSAFNQLYRFWAEVFLLAQEGSGAEPRTGTKWQLVVPKLVPVNIARVQDSPATVSHITAYNTKIDKVMDVLVYHPGTNLYRDF